MVYVLSEICRASLNIPYGYINHAKIEDTNILFSPRPLGPLILLRTDLSCVLAPQRSSFALTCSTYLLKGLFV